MAQLDDRVELPPGPVAIIFDLNPAAGRNGGYHHTYILLRGLQVARRLVGSL